jgi:hypothetical protein
MARRPADALAQLVVLFIAVAALNALRRGELGPWAAAKFMNRAPDPSPSSGEPGPGDVGGGGGGGGSTSWARQPSSSSSSPFPTLGDIAAGSSAGAAAPAGTVGGAVGAVGAVGGSTSSDSPELVQVGTTKMSKRFAARWVPMAREAAAQGVVLSGGAWRSNATQVQLRIAHGCGGSRVYDSSCKGTPPTAVPGRSRHETGDAIDVNLSGPGGRSSPEYRWLAANASRYGIYNLPSEPWHWSIDGQ